MSQERHHNDYEKWQAARQEIAADIARHSGVLPAAQMADAEAAANLEELLFLVAESIRQGKTMTWGPIGRHMKGVTSLAWDVNEYKPCRIALRTLTTTLFPDVGHMISVVVLNKVGHANSDFYEDAVRLKLLPRIHTPVQRKRFWLKEWEWWETWGKSADADCESATFMDLRRACHRVSENSSK